MSGFTPGPWSVGITTDGYEIEVVSDIRPYVCLVLPGAIEGVADANARLIAAAPELLEAAQAAWTCISELPPTQSSVEVAQLLLAAIDKATGEAA